MSFSYILLSDRKIYKKGKINYFIPANEFLFPKSRSNREMQKCKINNLEKNIQVSIAPTYCRSNRKMKK